MDSNNIDRGGESVQPSVRGSASDDRSTSGSSIALRGETDRAVDFLQRLIGSGQLAVAALDPNAGGCEGATFSLPEDVPALSAWIERRQGARNLYYTLNEPVPRAQQSGSAGRLRRADIQTLRGVGVDVDPRREVEGEAGGFERERARLMALVNEVVEADIGPAAIVDSGGGMQFVYLFSEPLPATPENVSAVEAQGRGLSRFYGGDPTHSIEHLFRVPFTINLPDARKRARGRSAAKARGIISDPPSRHSLSSLAQMAPPLFHKRSAPSAVPAFDVSTARSVLGAPEDLDEDLAARLDAARAESPRLDRLLSDEEPTTDRSSRDFAIATACVEAGITDGSDIADVVAAYSPEKFEERGDPYLARTVGRALQQAKPARPEDFFEVIDDETDISAPARAPSVWIDPRAWADQPLPEREWEVPNLIPKGEVTLVYGDGGVGKTLLMHQYATCAATGQPWLGLNVRKARVGCFLCEDDAQELHRRQHDINRALGIDFGALGDLQLIARKGEENLLATWDRGSGSMRLTPTWHRLRDDARALGLNVLILDTLADIFAGAEVDRAQVSAFVKGCLWRLAQEIGGSVIALGHPSMSGKSSGEGTAGSSAWNNACRSRLYLRYPGDDGAAKSRGKGNTRPPPSDIRELENMKLNYGPRGTRLKIRWVRGAFEPLMMSAVPTAIPSAAHVPRTEDAAQDALVRALIAFPLERLALAGNSPYYAPTVLKGLAPSILDAFSRPEIAAALERLQRLGAVVRVDVGKDTSSRPIHGLRVLPDKLASSLSSDEAKGPQSTPQSGLANPQSTPANPQSP
ncbi:MAG: AAA family ATPase [Parafilimonas terrae]|nr:AAA family ATPase [Parafilimonas terrae]